MTDGQLVTPEMLRAAGMASMPAISKRSMYHQNLMNLAVSVLPVVTQHYLSNHDGPDVCGRIAARALGIADDTICEGADYAADWSEAQHDQTRAERTATPKESKS